MKRADIKEAEKKHSLRVELLEILATKLYKDALKSQLNEEKENKIMMNRKNNKETRMETLKANGINTNNFFNLSMDIPVGANVEIKINGVPYTINSSNDEIVKDILDKGYVFNSRTDGRHTCAQTFKMLNNPSYNCKTRQCEYGWDAYLRNSYGYMYQFEMMIKELHRLSKMERSNDPEFERLSSFFTKEVVIDTCKHYINQLKKFIKKQPNRKYKGMPYVRLSKNGTVYVLLSELEVKVYEPLRMWLCAIETSRNYSELESRLREFVSRMVKLPHDTPKCPAFKDAFKGKGAYVTLLNIVKFHDCVVQNYETGEVLDTYGSVAYVESLLETHKGCYWKFHELLKATIELNKFDLKESIETQK